MTMWVMLAILIAAIGGYALGSIPFGLLLSRAAGLGDIRNIGSGNIGATNVLRTGRTDIAAATLALDAAKAAFAALLFTWLFGPLPGLVAGGAAFIGHCFPVWLKFKGGKGVATFFGVVVALSWPAWPVGIIAALVWIGTALLFRMSSLAALAAAAATPVIAYAFNRPGLAILSVLLALIVYWRHEANIRRLLKGEEPKIGAKTE